MIRLLSLVVVLVAVLPKLFELLLRREFHVFDSNGIVVMSGTSSGIGREACGALAERHADITFYCGVRRLQEDGIGYPFSRDNVEAVILDVTKQENVDAVMAKVQESGSPLIGIVNNAGIMEEGIIEFQTLDTFQWHFDVHVFGSFRLTKAALPLLRDNKGGRIIQIGSIMGRVSFATTAAYSGAKFAQEAFVDSLRKEVEDHGICVSIIEPGLIKTGLTDKSLHHKKITLEALKAGTAGTEEMQAYPHLFQQDQLESQLEMLESSGDANDTIAAIDDAMFGKFPKTRYLTAGMGPLPSWFVIPFLTSLADRLGDIIKVRGQMERRYNLEDAQYSEYNF